MGIFPGVASKEYCEKVINWFEQNKKPSHGGGKIVTRQELEGSKPSEKESDMYFFDGDRLGKGGGLDLLSMQINVPIVQEFDKITWRCYNKLKEKYGFLESLGYHKTSCSVKIQKYVPSQGYHVWHCEAANVPTSRRMLTSFLYLNTVESGGETEFLHSSIRIPPVQGTLTLFPAYWTHPHRGNPPLKGNKYIITTELEFAE